MSFFEDLGKKVSQTSQDAIKKTKIMAETTKISTQISAEKRIVADNYSKIGEKYYELFCDTPDQNLIPFIETIKEAKQKIDDYEEQILKLKGIESCPNCGAEIKDDGLFCTACGTKLPEPVAEENEATASEAKVCSNCGNPLPAGLKFCSGCGQKTE